MVQWHNSVVTPQSTNAPRKVGGEVSICQLVLAPFASFFVPRLILPFRRHSLPSHFPLPFKIALHFPLPFGITLHFPLPFGIALHFPLPFRIALHFPLPFGNASELPHPARWLLVLQTGEEKTDKKKEEAAQRHKAAEQYIQTPPPLHTHHTILVG